MIIGLDRAFKPEWVYKILKLSNQAFVTKTLNQNSTLSSKLKG